MNMDWECNVCHAQKKATVEFKEISTTTREELEIWNVREAEQRGGILVNIFCSGCGLLYHPSSVGIFSW